MEIGTTAVIKDFSKLKDVYAFFLNTGKVIMVEFSNLVGKPKSSKLLYGSCTLIRNSENKYTVKC